MEFMTIYWKLVHKELIKTDILYYENRYKI